VGALLGFLSRHDFSPICRLAAVNQAPIMDTAAKRFCAQENTMQRGPQRCGATVGAESLLLDVSRRRSAAEYFILLFQRMFPIYGELPVRPDRP
jgi:hypothetical protein